MEKQIQLTEKDMIEFKKAARLMQFLFTRLLKHAVTDKEAYHQLMREVTELEKFIDTIPVEEYS